MPTYGCSWSQSWNYGPSRSRSRKYIVSAPQHWNKGTDAQYRCVTHMYRWHPYKTQVTFLSPPLQIDLTPLRTRLSLVNLKLPETQDAVKKRETRLEHIIIFDSFALQHSRAGREGRRRTQFRIKKYTLGKTFELLAQGKHTHTHTKWNQSLAVHTFFYKGKITCYSVMKLQSGMWW